MKNFENRIKKLEEFLIPQSRDLNRSRFDVTKLTYDELVCLSDMLKRIRTETNHFDVSKLTPDEFNPA